MSRSGLLSDESILRHCFQYRPIPLALTNKILKIAQKPSSKFAKSPKYSQMPPRPATFDTLAQSVARIRQDPSLRESMEKTYDEEIEQLLQQLFENMFEPEVMEGLSEIVAEMPSEMPESPEVPESPAGPSTLLTGGPVFQQALTAPSRITQGLFDKASRSEASQEGPRTAPRRPLDAQTLQDMDDFIQRLDRESPFGTPSSFTQRLQEVELRRSQRISRPPERYSP